MDNINLQPIISAVIALIAALITTFLIPYIKGKISKQQYDRLLEAVRIAVAAAEQIFTSPQWCSEIIHAIYEKHLDPYFVVVASHNDAADILEALRAGATGYGIREGLSADRLRGILWGVAAGEIVLSGPVTSLRTGLLEQEKKPLPEYAFFQDLTKREREVLVFLVEGMSNAEISHQLFLSEPTVKKIIGRITEKLQVSNRVQAAVLAARYMMTHKL